MVLLLVYLFIAIGFSFYCSIAEAVLLSITPSFIATLKEKKPDAAQRLASLKSNIDRPLAAILSLNTIAHTAGAAGVGAQAYVAIPSVPLAAVSGVLTLLILVFSEIIPKTIGALYWRQLGPGIAVSVRWLIWLLFPLVWISERLTKLLSGGKSHHTLTREELAAMAEIGAQQGVLADQESRVFRSLMRFPKINVEDVMTPRPVVIAFDSQQTVGDVFAQHPQLSLSRYPIYEGKLDNPIGFVLRFDLLLAYTKQELDRPLSEFKREIVTVRNDCALPRLLETLLEGQNHIALVTDQYGSVVGLVTLEDVVETLLDLEIVDELDEEIDMQKYARDQWRKRATKVGLAIDSPETTASDIAAREAQLEGTELEGTESDSTTPGSTLPNSTPPDSDPPASERPGTE